MDVTNAVLRVRAALSRAVRAGVREDTSREDGRRIRLQNALALLGIVMSCVGHVGTGRPLDPELLVHLTVTVGGLAAVFALHVRGRPRDAALAFHGTLMTSILMGSWTIGLDYGNFFLLILGAALPFLLFPTREQTAALGTALAASICLAVLVYGWDLDGDLARRVAMYGPYQYLHQAMLVAVILLVGYGSRSFNALAEDDLELERAKSERLLRSVFPEEIGRRLQAGEQEIAERHGDASVLFCRVIGLDRPAEGQTSEAYLARLHAVIAAIDRRCAEFGAEKIKTTGTSFVAAAGLPVYRPDHAEVLVALALALRDEFAATPGISVRIGVNSGPVVAGVIGQVRPIYDLWGDTVNTAQRMEMHGLAGEVHVSPLTFAKINHRFECSGRESVEIKGKGAMKTYFVRGARKAGRSP
jgi:class 3 adenylate cyclase